MHINNFKVGSSITRTRKSSTGDGSYVGECLLYKGIANGIIYLQTRPGSRVFGLIDLALETFSEGWEHWVEPNLTTDSEFVFGRGEVSVQSGRTTFQTPEGNFAIPFIQIYKDGNTYEVGEMLPTGKAEVDSTYLKFESLEGLEVMQTALDFCRKILTK